MSAYAKAVTAFILAGIAALGYILSEPPLTVPQWVAVIVGVLGSPALVYAVPNKPAP